MTAPRSPLPHRRALVRPLGWPLTRSALISRAPFTTLTLSLHPSPFAPLAASSATMAATVSELLSVTPRREG